MSSGEVELLQKAGQKQFFEDGAVIFREGDPGDGLYLVLEGNVRIAAAVGQAGHRPLATVSAGDFFGEMAVLDREPRSAWAISEGATTLLFIPREQVLKFLENSPRVALNLVNEFSRRMREFNRRFVDEMLQADRLSMVGKFASSIVHDFKNPLGIIGMSAELGTMEGASQEIRDSSRVRIQKQVDRLSNMIGELLEFTRGSRKAQVVETNFAEFLHPLVAELQAESALNKVVIELENQPPPILLPLDTRRLPNLFFNLVHNAVDAMRPRGGKIFFRFSSTAAALITEIEDTGKGIPAEVAGKLFEPFATFGKAGGTGLGLSICKRIVEDHGGTISARNEPGRGAIFRFSLPLKGS